LRRNAGGQRPKNPEGGSRNQQSALATTRHVSPLVF
jgi:hypothetical protein